MDIAWKTEVRHGAFCCCGCLFFWGVLAIALRMPSQFAYVVTFTTTSNNNVRIYLSCEVIIALLPSDGEIGKDCQTTTTSKKNE